MKVHMYVSTQSAIRASKTRTGQVAIEITEEDLAALTDEQREELALSNVVDQEPAYSAHALGNGYGEPRIAEATIATMVEVLQYRIEKRAENKEEAERKQAEILAKCEQIATDWLAEHEGQPEEALCEYIDNNFNRLDAASRPDYPYDERLPEDHPLAIRVQTVVDIATKIANARNADTVEQREKAKAERKEQETAKRVAYETEREQWIGEHGSRRLRLLLSEGLGLNKTYQDERLAAERPRWVWYGEICGVTVGLRDASEGDLDELVNARKIAPDAKLQWLKYDDCDCCTENEEATEYEDLALFRPRPIIEAEFLGRIIVREIGKK